MKKRITYREFKSFLRKANYYSDKEIRHLFNSVKQLDKETKGWVIDWINTGEYPSKEVEQVTVRVLVEDFGYKPIAAFIAIDWLKQDPQAAKYFMVKIAKTDPDAVPSDAADEEVGEEYICGLDTTDTSDEDITTE